MLISIVAAKIEQLKQISVSPIYLNMYKVDPNTTKEEVYNFYHPLKIDCVHFHEKVDMFDLEFSNKEDAIKILEKGTGVNFSNYLISVLIFK